MKTLVLAALLFAAPLHSTPAQAQSKTLACAVTMTCFAVPIIFFTSYCYRNYAVCMGRPPFTKAMTQARPGMPMSEIVSPLSPDPMTRVQQLQSARQILTQTCVVERDPEACEAYRLFRTHTVGGTRGANP